MVDYESYLKYPFMHVSTCRYMNRYNYVEYCEVSYVITNSFPDSALPEREGSGSGVWPVACAAKKTQKIEQC